VILKLVTPPSAEPVNIALAKAHLRVDGSDDDLIINQIIAAARQWAEDFQNRAYVTQTRRLTLDEFPGDDAPIVLPNPPLQSVVSVQYLNTDGVSTALAATEYVVDTDREPGRIYLAYEKDWPDTQDIQNAVQITYRCGYATPFTAVPSTDVLTAYGRTFATGDTVRLGNSGGELPAGLAKGIDYYIVPTMKVSAALGGTAVDITAAGSGTHFIGTVPEKVVQAMLLLIMHWYDDRSAVITGPRMISTQVHRSLDSLLWQDRIAVI